MHDERATLRCTLRGLRERHSILGVHDDLQPAPKCNPCEELLFKTSISRTR
jgi:hypothetical protein